MPLSWLGSLPFYWSDTIMPYKDPKSERARENYRERNRRWRAKQPKKPKFDRSAFLRKRWASITPEQRHAITHNMRVAGANSRTPEQRSASAREAQLRRPPEQRVAAARKASLAARKQWMNKTPEQRSEKSRLAARKQWMNKTPEQRRARMRSANRWWTNITSEQRDVIAARQRLLQLQRIFDNV
jgi:hypothetical protein